MIKGRKFADTKPQNQRPGFKGEKHPPLKVADPFKFKKGNFLGPGTKIVARINRNDQPINYSDKVAKAHDLRYSLAKNSQDVRKADLKMIATIKKAIKEKKDFPINLRLGQFGISGKVALEKLNIVGPTTFASFGDVPESAKPKLKSELVKLEKQGFGKLKKRKTKKTKKRK